MVTTYRRYYLKSIDEPRLKVNSPTALAGFAGTRLAVEDNLKSPGPWEHLPEAELLMHTRPAYHGWVRASLPLPS